MAERACQGCGGPIVQPRRGRRRVFCATCRPPGDSTPRMRAWRAAHPEYDERHNAARRVPRLERRCSVCGTKFEPPRSDSQRCGECLPVIQRARGRGVDIRIREGTSARVVARELATLAALFVASRPKRGER